MWKTNGQINEQTYLIKQQGLVVPVISLLQGSPRFLLYPDSGISMDEEIVLGDMIWSYNKAEL